MLAEARNGDAFVEARGIDVERAAVLDAIELECRRLGQVRQMAVASPDQAATGFVEDSLNLIVGHIAAHADGDLAVLVAGRHIVVVLDLVRPAGEDLLAHAGLLNHLMRREAAGGIVGHVAGQVLPVIGLEVVHDQATHLANVGVEAEHARVLVDHGSVAARGGDHLDASAGERHDGLDELGRRVAVVVAQHARAGREHGGVQVGKDVFNLGKTLAHLARKLSDGRQGIVGHGHSITLKGLLVLRGAPRLRGNALGTTARSGRRRHHSSLVKLGNID